MRGTRIANECRAITTLPKHGMDNVALRQYQMAAFGWDFLFIFVWTATTPPRRCHGSCLLAKGKWKSFISPGSSRIRAGPRSIFSQAVNQHLAPSLPLPHHPTYCLFCVIIVSLYWFMRRIDAEGAESNSFGSFRERACKSVLLCDVWDYFGTHTHTRPLCGLIGIRVFFSQACSCWVYCCCCFLAVQIQTIKFTHRDIDSEDVEEHFFGKKDDYYEENPGTLRNRIKRNSSMSLLLDDHPAQWVVLHSLDLRTLLLVRCLTISAGFIARRLLLTLHLSVGSCAGVAKPWKWKGANRVG